MTGRILCALTIALLTSAALIADQQPQPPAAPASDTPPVVFRAEVNYVEVDASVFDAQGKNLADLDVNDFEVREDGVLQKVTTFSRVDLPAGLGARVAAPGGRVPIVAPDPVELDVQTNEQGDGRIYMIVLDDLNTDFSRTVRVKDTVGRFLKERFGPNDMAAIAYTGSSRANQDFTNNVSLLLAALDTFRGQKLQSETAARLERAQVLVPVLGRQAPTGEMVTIAPTIGNGSPMEIDPHQHERATRARSSIATVRRLADFMASVRGRRKAMLLVGEGVDFNIDQSIEADDSGTFGTDRNAQVAALASTIRADAHDAIAAATRGNVSIYALDPRGLATLDGEDPIGPEPDNTKSMAEMNAEMGTGPAPVKSPRPDRRTIQAEIRRAQNSLRSLAENTGGFATVNQNDLNGAFERIVAENSSYYVLGYSTGNSRRDGKYRKLDIRVKRAGVRVRARGGYYEADRTRKLVAEAPITEAVATATSPAVAAALGSPLPVSRLPLKVFAAPFRGEADTATIAIAIEVDAEKLDLTPTNAVDKELEVVFAATSSDGKVYQQNDPHGVKLSMPNAGDVKDGATVRVRALSDLSLPPGRYQLRVAVGNKAGRAGSVIYDLDVPDFRKEPLMMSGVAVASASEKGDVSMPKVLQKFLPGPPTAMREFARGETIALFAEIYENAPDTTPHTLDLRMELRAMDGKTVDGVAEERSSAARADQTAAYRFAPELPLDADVTPGPYLLHVEARGAGGVSVSRNITIRIR